jgi:probable phosphoglycerate mutase
LKLKYEMTVGKNVWLIRHGESESNAGLPTAAPALIRLTPKGIEQSRYIPRAFSAPPQLIVTSPYMRTGQTAEALFDRFPDVRREEWPVQEFTYLSLPPDRPMTLVERRPMVDAYWRRNDPLSVDGDGAESFGSLVNRVEWFLDELRKREETFMAVFNHGHFMRAVMWSLILGSIPISSESMNHYHSFITALAMPNGSIVKFRFTEAGAWLLSRPDTAHLPPELK